MCERRYLESFQITPLAHLFEKKTLILLIHRSLHNLIVSVSLFVNACNVLILILLVCCDNHFVIFL